MHVELQSGPDAVARFVAAAAEPELTARRLDVSNEPFWRTAERGLFLARDGRRLLGRVAAIALEHQPEWGSFAWLDCGEDPRAARVLLDACADWLRARGRRTMRGPLHLSLGGELGALVSGFQPPPMLFAPHNAAALPGLLVAAGMRSVAERHGYAWTRDELPAPPYALRQPALEDGVRYWPLDPGGRGASETADFLSLVNDQREGRPGSLPISADDARARVRELLAFGDPRLVWFASVDDEPAGVAIALPEISQAEPEVGSSALRRLRAALRGKRLERVHLSTLVAAPRHAGRDIEGHLLLRVWRAALDLGASQMELGVVDEGDAVLHNLLWRLGARRARRYAVYERTL
jgi:hypothetical protein